MNDREAWASLKRAHQHAHDMAVRDDHAQRRHWFTPPRKSGVVDVTFEEIQAKPTGHERGQNDQPNNEHREQYDQQDRRR